MDVFLDTLLIQLDSRDPEVAEHLRPLFLGWPPNGRENTEPIGSKPKTTRKPDCIFQLEIVETPPPMPEGIPHFTEKAHSLPSTVGFVSIFQNDGVITIFFHDGAIIQLAPEIFSEKNTPHIKARIARRLFRGGRLEDIIFTGLAPLLRRKGYFLLHAFAAVKSGRSILLIGPSNSGKTTAGLGLTTAGWGYLANDVVMLKLVDNDVYALPTPGAIGLSAQTIQLVPRLKNSLSWMPDLEFPGKKYLPVNGLNMTWAEAAPVRTICFPTIHHQQACELKEVNKAMTLALLLESSIDRWDQAMLEDHFNLLQRLMEQAGGYELLVGDQVAQWSTFLSQI